MDDLIVLATGLVMFTLVCVIGWAFGWFGPKWEIIWETRPGKAIPIARWIRTHGTPDIDAYLEMDVDKVRMGDYANNQGRGNPQREMASPDRP